MDVGCVLGLDWIGFEGDGMEERRFSLEVGIATLHI